MAEYGEELTDRELETLQLVATGATNREVAYRLNISTNTVKVHLRHVFTKLGAESRTEATMIAVRRGWVKVPGAETAPSESDAEAEELAQPLSGFRRGVLVAAAVIVVAATAISWPRPARSQGDSPGPLPARMGEGDATRIEVGEDSHWSERAQMPTRRAGLALAAWEGKLYAVGGEGPEEVSGVVEIYDPDADVWERGVEKPTPVAYAGAALLGGRIYVPGGRVAEGEATAVVEVYDPTTEQWTEVAPLPVPLYAYALSAHDGKIYVFGGTSGMEAVRSTYVYDPADDEWEERAPMSRRRTVAAATTLEERIYVVGGYLGGEELKTCEVYDPAADRWEACAPLTVGRSGLGLAALGGRLYAIGGGRWFNERYDPRSDTWTAVETPLTAMWQSPGVAVIDMTVYVVGGWSQGYESLNLAFEPLPYRIFIPATER